MTALSKLSSVAVRVAMSVATSLSLAGCMCLCCDTIESSGVTNGAQPQGHFEVILTGITGEAAQSLAFQLDQYDGVDIHTGDDFSWALVDRASLSNDVVRVRLWIDAGSPEQSTVNPLCFVSPFTLMAFPFWTDYICAVELRCQVVGLGDVDLQKEAKVVFRGREVESSLPLGFLPMLWHEESWVCSKEHAEATLEQWRAKQLPSYVASLLTKDLYDSAMAEKRRLLAKCEEEDRIRREEEKREELARKKRAAERRAKVLKRIADKRSQVETLFKNGEYDKVISLWEEEWVVYDYDPENVDVIALKKCRDAAVAAKEERAAAQRAAEQARIEAERAAEQARIKAERAAEQVRINEKVKQLEALLASGKYEKVVALSAEETGARPGSRSEDAEIWLNFRIKAETAMLKAGGSPLSFCGVNFGERIDLRFPDAEFKDNSQERNYEYSYLVADLTLGTPFRNFRTGKVYGSMTSRKIYKIELEYEFPREVSAAVDNAEYQETLSVLKRKYGTGCTEREGFGGNKTNVFKVGNVLITLKFVTEGVIDRGHLILTAENQGLRGVAEAECQKYYQERSRRDVQNMKGFQNGGIDAL